MEDNTTGWVKLYHPSGAQVTVPLSLDNPITAEQASGLFTSLGTLITAGFTVSPEDLEAGEQAIDINAVVRRSKSEDDGTETPVIDTYMVNGTYRWVAKYLNNPDDIAAFEAATGLKLNDLPLYEGSNSIELGKNAKLDKYVVRLNTPAKLVWKLNPRYEGLEDKKNPKRLFVRWDSHKVKPTNGNNSQPKQTPPTPEAAPAELEAALAVVIPEGIKIPKSVIGKTLGDAIGDPNLGAAVLSYLAGEKPNLAGELFAPEGDEQDAVKKAAEAILKNKQAPPKRSKK